MKIDLSHDNPLKHATPALVIGCFEDHRDELFTACDAALDGMGGFACRLLSERREGVASPGVISGYAFLAANQPTPTAGRRRAA